MTALNLADDVRLGPTNVDRVYLGANLLWPDADAQAYLDATTLVDRSSKLIAHKLVKALKAKGLWSLLYTAYFYMGTTAAQHKFNIKNPVDSDGANRLTYHGTITHDAHGMKGDGLSGWADSHFVPSAHFSPADASMGFYSVTAAPFTKQYDMGASDAVSTTAYLVSAYFSTTNKAIAAMGNTALNAGNQFPPGADSTGMYIANRPDSTHVQLWRNAVLLGTAPDPGNACNTPVALMAINVAGAPTRWSILGHAFSFTGHTMTSQQIADLTSIVQAFQVSMGRV